MGQSALGEGLRQCGLLLALGTVRTNLLDLPSPTLMDPLGEEGRAGASLKALHSPWGQLQALCSAWPRTSSLVHGDGPLAPALGAWGGGAAGGDPRLSGLQSLSCQDRSSPTRTAW